MGLFIRVSILLVLRLTVSWIGQLDWLALPRSSSLGMIGSTVNDIVNDGCQLSTLGDEEMQGTCPLAIRR